jgi:hypothetical protein
VVVRNLSEEKHVVFIQSNFDLLDRQVAQKNVGSILFDRDVIHLQQRVFGFLVNVTSHKSLKFFKLELHLSILALLKMQVSELGKQGVFGLLAGGNLQVNACQVEVEYQTAFIEVAWLRQT